MIGRVTGSGKDHGVTERQRRLMALRAENAQLRAFVVALVKRAETADPLTYATQITAAELIGLNDAEYHLTSAQDETGLTLTVTATPHTAPQQAPETRDLVAG